MLAKILAVTLFAVAAASAQADGLSIRENSAQTSEWTTTDTALQLTVVALQVIDWGQTRWGLDRQHVEANPLLGSAPSRLRLDLSVAGAILGHALVSYVLPKPWRTVWQVAAISAEVLVVNHNAAVIGLHWTFP